MLLRQLDKPTIAWIQGQLVKAGLLRPSDVDGIVGVRTESAFRLFKLKAYLTLPDQYGATTEKFLREIDGTGRPVPSEAVKPLKVISLVSHMVLPYGMGTIELNKPVDGCQHITWAEMTKNGSRVPQSKLVVQNIIRVSLQLEKVRRFLGDHPIQINSAYRPEAINRAVGGVSNSRHIVGDAADVVVKGIPPMVVARRINSLWGTTGGIGFHPAFTHLDCRGYAARFDY